MFSNLSDLISHNQSIDSAIRLMSRTREFEELIRSYSLLDLNINCYEIREQTAYVKCYKDHIDIHYIRSGSQMSTKIATIKLFNNGTFEVETFADEIVADHESFIRHLRRIFS